MNKTPNLSYPCPPRTLQVLDYYFFFYVPIIIILSSEKTTLLEQSNNDLREKFDNSMNQISIKSENVERFITTVTNNEGKNIYIITIV